jgi:hypothetical protein
MSQPIFKPKKGPDYHARTSFRTGSMIRSAPLPVFIFNTHLTQDLRFSPFSVALGSGTAFFALFFLCALEKSAGAQLY